MSVNYPYAVGTGKIPVLFDKISKVGKPSKVDTNWLKSIGLVSGNDTRLLTVLRHIGFVDSAKSPTELWQQYRGTKGKVVLAQAIRASYSELYETYPEAHNVSSDDLRNFVRSHTELGTETVDRIVNTFRALVALADFSEDAPTPVREKPSDAAYDRPSNDTDPAGRHGSQIRGGTPSGVVINVNLQLSLPATTDPQVYELLFAALSRHVLMSTGSDD